MESFQILITHAFLLVCWHNVYVVSPKDKIQTCHEITDFSGGGRISVVVVRVVGKIDDISATQRNTN